MRLTNHRRERLFAFSRLLFTALVCGTLVGAQTPGFAQSTGKAVQSASKVNLNLSSTNKSIQASQLLGPTSSARITVAGHGLAVNASTDLTPAEYVALLEVMSGGRQTIRLGLGGNAVGGGFNISTLQTAISNLVIPQGITAIGNSGKDGATLQLTGDLTNEGKLDGINLTISAGSSIINQGNIIGLRQLTLEAPSISNSGVLTSNGNASLFANDLSNSGSIRASGGSLTVGPFNSDILNVDSTGGTMVARTINFSNTPLIAASSVDANAGISLNGGDLTARQINFSAPGGNAVVVADKLNGTTNVWASTAAVGALDGSVKLGTFDVHGDPIIFAAGSVDLGSGGSNLFAPGGTNMYQTNGADFIVLAGGDINATGAVAGSAGIDAQNTSNGGIGGQIVLVAGTNFTISNSGCTTCTQGVDYTVGTPTSGGGSINIPNVDLITNGAPVSLTANKGTIAGSGKVSAYDIWTDGYNGSGSAGQNGGAVTITAGSNVVLDSIYTAGGNGDAGFAGGKGGDVTITSGGSVSVNAGVGGIWAYGGYGGGGTPASPAGGAGGAGGNVTVTSAGNFAVTGDDIFTLGGGGGGGAAAAGGTGGAGGSGGSVTLTSTSGSIFIDDELVVAGGGGGGGGATAANAGGVGAGSGNVTMNAATTIYIPMVSAGNGGNGQAGTTTAGGGGGGSLGGGGGGGGGTTSGGGGGGYEGGGGGGTTAGGSGGALRNDGQGGATGGGCSPDPFAGRGGSSASNAAAGNYGLGGTGGGGGSGANAGTSSGDVNLTATQVGVFSVITSTGPPAGTICDNCSIFAHNVTITEAGGSAVGTIYDVNADYFTGTASTTGHSITGGETLYLNTGGTGSSEVYGTITANNATVNGTNIGSVSNFGNPSTAYSDNAVTITENGAAVTKFDNGSGADVTPAEWIAMIQVSSGTHTQTLTLDSTGNATGGSFNIASGNIPLSGSFSTLILPSGVKADSSVSSLTYTGSATINGTLQFASTGTLNVASGTTTIGAGGILSAAGSGLTINTLGLTNNGTISTTATGGTTISVASTSTLSLGGTGTITQSNATPGTTAFSATTSITLASAANLTIQGGGGIKFGTPAFIFGGTSTLNASGNSAITMTGNGGDVTISGPGSGNTGTISTGGTITVLNEGTAHNLTLNGTGTIALTATNVDLNGATFTVGSGLSLVGTATGASMNDMVEVSASNFVDNGTITNLSTVAVLQFDDWGYSSITFSGTPGTISSPNGIPSFGTNWAPGSIFIYGDTINFNTSYTFNTSLNSVVWAQTSGGPGIINVGQSTDAPPVPSVQLKATTGTFMFYANTVNLYNGALNEAEPTTYVLQYMANVMNVNGTIRSLNPNGTIQIDDSGLTGGLTLEGTPAAPISIASGGTWGTINVEDYNGGGITFATPYTLNAGGGANATINVGSITANTPPTPNGPGSFIDVKGALTLQGAGGGITFSTTANTGGTWISITAPITATGQNLTLQVSGYDASTTAYQIDEAGVGSITASSLTIQSSYNTAGNTVTTNLNGVNNIGALSGTWAQNGTNTVLNNVILNNSGNAGTLSLGTLTNLNNFNVTNGGEITTTGASNFLGALSMTSTSGSLNINNNMEANVSTSLTATSGTTTVASGVTLGGSSGWIAIQSASVVNNGTISTSNTNGGLPTSLNIMTNHLTDNGTIESTGSGGNLIIQDDGSGTLTMDGTVPQPITDNGGILFVEAGSTLNIDSGYSFIGSNGAWVNVLSSGGTVNVNASITITANGDGQAQLGTGAGGGTTNIAAGTTVNITGGYDYLLTPTMNIGSGATINATTPQIDVSSNNLNDNGTIQNNYSGGIIDIYPSNGGTLNLYGSPTVVSTTGAGAGIYVQSGTTNLQTSYKFDPGTGSGSFVEMDNTALNLSDNAVVTIASGAALKLDQATLSMGNGSQVSATGASNITIDNVSGTGGLTIQTATGGSSTISTATGGSINITGPSNQMVQFATSSGSGSATLNFTGAPVSVTSNNTGTGTGIEIDTAVNSAQAITLTTNGYDGSGTAYAINESSNGSITAPSLIIDSNYNTTAQTVTANLASANDVGAFSGSWAENATNTVLNNVILNNSGNTAAMTLGTLTNLNNFTLTNGGSISTTGGSTFGGALSMTSNAGSITINQSMQALTATLQAATIVNNSTVTATATTGTGITAQSVGSSLTISGAGTWTTSGSSVNFQNTSSSTASVILDNSTQTITGGGNVIIMAPVVQFNDVGSAGTSISAGSSNITITSPTLTNDNLTVQISSSSTTGANTTGYATLSTTGSISIVPDGTGNVTMQLAANPPSTISAGQFNFAGQTTIQSGPITGSQVTLGTGVTLNATGPNNGDNTTLTIVTAHFTDNGTITLPTEAASSDTIDVPAVYSPPTALLLADTLTITNKGIPGNLILDGTPQAITIGTQGAIYIETFNGGDITINSAYSFKADSLVALYSSGNINLNASCTFAVATGGTTYWETSQGFATGSSINIANGTTQTLSGSQGWVYMTAPNINIGTGAKLLAGTGVEMSVYTLTDNGTITCSTPGSSIGIDDGGGSNLTLTGSPGSLTVTGPGGRIVVGADVDALNINSAYTFDAGTGSGSYVDIYAVQGLNINAPITVTADPAATASSPGLSLSGGTVTIGAAVSTNSATSISAWPSTAGTGIQINAAVNAAGVPVTLTAAGSDNGTAYLMNESGGSIQASALHVSFTGTTGSNLTYTANLAGVNNVQSLTVAGSTATGAINNITLNNNGNTGALTVSALTDINNFTLSNGETINAPTANSFTGAVSMTSNSGNVSITSALTANVSLSLTADPTGAGAVTATGSLTTGPLTVSSGTGGIVLNGLSITSLDGTATGGAITLNQPVATDAGGNGGHVFLNAGTDITTSGIITDGVGVGNAGDIKLIAGDNIQVNGTITQYGGSTSGNAGNLTMTATTGSITDTSDIDNSPSSGTGNTGTITYTAGTSINIANIWAGTNSGTAGLVSLNAGTSITTGQINSAVNGGTSLGISLTAGTSVNTGGLKATNGGTGPAGPITISAGTTSTTSWITTNATNGTSGAVSITAGQGITSDSIYTYSAAGGNGGNITLNSGTATFNLNSIFASGAAGAAGALTFQQGTSTLSNPTVNIVTGAYIDVHSDTNSAASPNVDINLGNSNSLADILTYNSGSGGAGNITLTSSNPITFTNVSNDLNSSSGGSTGNAGNISITTTGALSLPGSILANAVGTGSGGTVNLSSVGAFAAPTISSVGNGGASNGDITVQATGAVTTTGAITGHVVNITSTGSTVAISTAVTGAGATGQINLTATPAGAGAVSSTVALAASTLTVSSGTGGIAINGTGSTDASTLAANSTGTVNILDTNNANLTLNTSSGSSFTLNTSGSVSGITGGGILTAGTTNLSTGSGGISFTGANTLSTSNLTLNTSGPATIVNGGAGALILNSGGSTFSSLSVSTDNTLTTSTALNSSGTVSLVSTDSSGAGTVSLGGSIIAPTSVTLTATNGGTISQSSGSIQSAALFLNAGNGASNLTTNVNAITLNSGGDATIGNTSHTAGATLSVTGNTGSLTITQNNAILLNNLSATNTLLSVDVPGTVNTSGTVSAATSFTISNSFGNNISINNTGAVTAGTTVSANAAGTINVTNTSSISATNVSLTTGAGLTVSGAGGSLSGSSGITGSATNANAAVSITQDTISGPVSGTAGTAYSVIAKVSSLQANTITANNGDLYLHAGQDVGLTGGILTSSGGNAIINAQGQVTGLAGSTINANASAVGSVAIGGNTYSFTGGAIGIWGGSNITNAQADAKLLGWTQQRIYQGTYTTQVQAPGSLTGTPTINPIYKTDSGWIRIVATSNDIDVTGATLNAPGGVIYIDPNVSLAGVSLNATQPALSAPPPPPPPPTPTPLVGAPPSPVSDFGLPPSISIVVPGASPTITSGFPTSAITPYDQNQAANFAASNNRLINQIVPPCTPREMQVTVARDNGPTTWYVAENGCETFSYHGKDGLTVVGQKGTEFAPGQNDTMQLNRGKILASSTKLPARIETKKGIVVLAPGSTAIISQLDSGRVSVEMLEGPQAVMNLKDQSADKPKVATGNTANRRQQLTTPSGQELVIGDDDDDEQELIPVDGMEHTVVEASIKVVGGTALRAKINVEQIATYDPLFNCTSGCLPAEIRNRFTKLKGTQQAKAPTSTSGKSPLSPVAYQSAVLGVPTLASYNLSGGSMRYLNNSKFRNDNGAVTLTSGQTVITADTAMTVSTPQAKINLLAGDIVVITCTADATSIIPIWSNSDGSTTVMRDGIKTVPRLGQDVTICNNEAALRRFQNSDTFARRNVRITETTKGARLMTSEVSLVSMITGKTPIVEALMTSKLKEDTTITSKLKKMAVVLSVVTGGHGNYAPPSSEK